MSRPCTFALIAFGKFAAAATGAFAVLLAAALWGFSLTATGFSATGLTGILSLLRARLLPGLLAWLLAALFLSRLAGTLATFLGQRVIIQLALFPQDFRQTPHGIGQFLFFGRQVFLFAIGLLTGHARHATRAGLTLLEFEILKMILNS